MVTAGAKPKDPTFASLDELLDGLRERVFDFPVDFEQRLDEPLRELFTHAQLQLMIVACQVLVPDLARGALAPSATAGDLLHALENAVDSGRAVAALIPRGVYRSPNVTLRPIAEQDVSALYLSSLDPPDNHRWRFRGRTPHPDAFRHSLFGDGVLAQFMVAELEDPVRAIGLVSAYSADLASGHCYVAFQRCDGGRSSSSNRGLMIEGLLVFIEYLFDHFDFHKVYLEIPEYNRYLIGNDIPTVVQREGQLANHYYFGGRRWDLDIYAVYREVWDPIAALYLGDWEDPNRSDG